MRRTRGDHVGQITLNVGGMRRSGMQAGVQVQRADPRVDGADHPRLAPGSAQDRVEEVRRRRFSVGAGDAGQRQMTRWEAVPGRVQPAQRPARVGHAQIGESGGQIQDGGRFFTHNGNRASSQSRRDKTVAIHRHAPHRDEQKARLHFPGIVGDASDRRFGTCKLKHIRHNSTQFTKLHFIPSQNQRKCVKSCH